MALLSFPSVPFNGQIYPVNPLVDQHQYKWIAADNTWILLGLGTGVIPGTYGDEYNIPQFTVDATGRITFAQNIPFTAAPWTLKGQLVAGTGVRTQTILDPGVDTSILVTDSTTTSGLAWSDSSTEGALLPSGASADRPSAPILGQIRYNSENNEFEGYQGVVPAWEAFSTMPTGGVTTTGSTEKIFYLNDQTIFVDYTVPATKNAMSAGPLVIDAGVTVTVPAGAAWTII